MKVREIMTSGSLATATLDTTLEEIANMMKAEDVGAIPVLDDDEKLAGIVTDRDIVVRAIAEGQDPTECTAEDILSEQLHIIEPDIDVDEAAELMARHQIRRLPVVEDEQVIGIISLGDISVKSRQEEAGDALEEISSGVRQQSGSQDREEPARGRQELGRDRQERSGEEERGRQAGGGDSRRAQGQSAGEQVAAEETEYQRGHQDTSLRGASQAGGPQAGGTRSESGLSGRTRNASQSRQSVMNDLVNTEGEEEPEFQNAGGGQARQRANQQNAAARGKQPPARGQKDAKTRGRQESARGRQDISIRGRASGGVRGEGGARPRSGKSDAQGISNRSSRQENQRQQKVAPMRAEGKNARGQGKRRAS